MKIYRIEDFTRGWIIGDFEPSLIKTKDFEVGLLKHKKDEVWPNHVHMLADEYNVLVSGKMLIKYRDEEWYKLLPGDVFVIAKGDSCKPMFLEDCTLLVVKVPSVIGDKNEV